MSGDEQRRLCADQKYGPASEPGLGLGISLTTYGSVAYQLKDANLEATGTCDFVCKAMSIVNKTGKFCLFIKHEKHRYFQIDITPALKTTNAF